MPSRNYIAAIIGARKSTELTSKGTAILFIIFCERSSTISTTKESARLLIYLGRERYQPVLTRKITLSGSGGFYCCHTCYQSNPTFKPGKYCRITVCFPHIVSIEKCYILLNGCSEFFNLKADAIMVAIDHTLAAQCVR